MPAHTSALVRHKLRPTLSLATEILSYINALKWPVVISGGVYYFRKPFVHILERISEASKGAITGPGGTSVSWDNTLKEVDAAIDEAKRQTSDTEPEPQKQAEAALEGPPAPPPPPVPSQRPHWPGLRDLAHVSPQAAVVLSFTQIDQALREFALEREIPNVDRMGAGRLARKLGLKQDTIAALGDLAQLRNEVIHHAAEPDENMAVDYVDSAERFYGYITGYLSMMMEMNSPGRE